MCDCSEINVIQAYWLLCVIAMNKGYSSLLIMMCDSSEINVIQAY